MQKPNRPRKPHHRVQESARINQTTKAKNDLRYLATSRTTKRGDRKKKSSRNQASYWQGRSREAAESNPPAAAISPNHQLHGDPTRESDPVVDPTAEDRAPPPPSPLALFLSLSLSLACLQSSLPFIKSGKTSPLLRQLNPPVAKALSRNKSYINYTKRFHLFSI